MTTIVQVKTTRITIAGFEVEISRVEGLSSKLSLAFCRRSLVLAACLAAATLLLSISLPETAAAAIRNTGGDTCKNSVHISILLKQEKAQLLRAKHRMPSVPAKVVRRIRGRIDQLRRDLKCKPVSSSSAINLPSDPVATPENQVATPETIPPPSADSPSSETSPGVETEHPKVPLSVAVKGNQLVDGNGDTVLLHGVNLSGTMWSCLNGKAFASPIDDAALASMIAWHVNAVRIPMNEDCWLGINGAPTNVDAYHAEIRDFVERLNALGIYVILDLHWNAPGTTLAHLGVGFEGEFEMADLNHAPAFWESVASYFKDDPAVLFDLFNEPFGISWSCWREGCHAPRGFQTAGMQRLVEAVRSTGATQPVMVAGLQRASLAGEEWLRNRPLDPAGQLVASIHAYGVLGGYPANIGVVAKQVPVVMSEIGEKDCADKALDNLLPWADSNGVSYLAWAWYTGDCSKGPALISNYSGTPTPYGIGFREHLVHTFPAPSPPSTGL